MNYLLLVPSPEISNDVLYTNKIIGRGVLFIKKIKISAFYSQYNLSVMV